MPTIFNTRKLNANFDHGAADLVEFIASYKGIVTNDVIRNLPLARQMERAGVLDIDTRGYGWDNEWSINYRFLLDNGYFSKRGEELADAGEEMQSDYFTAVKAGTMAEYYAKWGNAQGREYIIVP